MSLISRLGYAELGMEPRPLYTLGKPSSSELQPQPIRPFLFSTFGNPRGDHFFPYLTSCQAVFYSDRGQHQPSGDMGCGPWHPQRCLQTDRPLSRLWGQENEKTGSLRS